jgi:N-methylhydantoinase A
VIVPAFPGALSALGILSSDVVKDYSRTVLWRVSRKIPQATVNREFGRLEQAALGDFAVEHWSTRPRFLRSIDLRYRGQGYELNLALTKNLIHDFEQEHRRRYGYSHANREIEIVTLRLRAVLEPARQPASVADRERNRGTDRSPAPEASVVFDGHRIRAKLYRREGLRKGTRYRGPAIVTEYSATTAVPPGKSFWIDPAGNLLIRDS